MIPFFFILSISKRRENIVKMEIYLASAKLYEISFACGRIPFIWSMGNSSVSVGMAVYMDRDRDSRGGQS